MHDSDEPKRELDRLHVDHVIQEETALLVPQMLQIVALPILCSHRARRLRINNHRVAFCLGINW